MGIARADICSSEDFATIDRLRDVIAELGGVGNTDHYDLPLGVGLTRVRFGDDELTVFMDAWQLDIAGPEKLVSRVLAKLNTRD